MTSPALNESTFEKVTAAERGAGWAAPAPDTLSPWPPAAAPPPADVPAMRVGGVASASFVLLAILLVTGWVGWQAVELVKGRNALGEVVVVETRIPPWLIVSLLVGLGLAVLTIFKPHLARITGPLYAAAEGLLVGGISHMYEVRFDGIVLQAVGLTIGVFLVMLVLFATRTIRVTEKLRMAVVASTCAIGLVYMASLLLRLFGADIPFIHDAGPLGILFSLFVVGLASMNLLLDFDLIEKGVAMKAPRYMEWYAAFALFVTLIWLYLELLRLLGKLRSR
jgi:uncharacterized YccA/Bax inhibitor family protein